MRTYSDGTVTNAAGTLIFPTLSPLPAGVSFRLDYTIDWSAGSANAHNALTSASIRGQLNLPDDFNIIPSTDRRRIIGNIAMSPKGTIYVVSSTQQDNPNPPLNHPARYDSGSFYAIREDIGRGGFRLLTRYNLYPSHSITLNQAAPVTYPSALVDNDPLLSFVPGGMLLKSSGRFS